MALDELREAEAAVAVCRRAAARAEALAVQISQEQHACAAVRKRLADEQDDVDALEQLSVASLLARARGRLDDQQRRERAEVAAVEIELATHQATLARLTAEFEATRDRSLGLADATARLDAAIAAREQEISTGADAEQLAALDERLTAERAAREQIVATHQAAIGADGALRRVIDQLKSARAWSRWDTFADGDWLASQVKHQRLDDSVVAQADAHASLLRLRSELGELATAIHHPHLTQVSSGQAFRDVWLDNIVTDLNVHAKIAQSIGELERSLHDVSEMLPELATQDRISAERVASLEAERDLLLRRS